MSLVIDAIQQFAHMNEQRIAIVQQQRRISYCELWDTIQCWQVRLRQSGARAAACCTGDRLQALEFNLACQAAGIASLVLPSDCPAATLRQLVLHHGIEQVLSDGGALLDAADLPHNYCEQTGLYSFLSPLLQQGVLPASCAILSLDPAEPTLARLLSVSQQTVDHTVQHLARLRDELGVERHLSLPFAPALSEMLSGQYASLMTGGCCVMPKQSSVRHLGNQCTELIDDYAHFLVSNDIQSVLIPAKCRRLLLQFVEHNAGAVSSLNLLLVAAQPHSDGCLAEKSRAGQTFIYDLWGTPGHALPYALLRPAARRARMLPHCKLSVGASDRLFVHGASIEFEDLAPDVQHHPLDTGLTGFVDAADFLHLVDAGASIEAAMNCEQLSA